MKLNFVTLDVFTAARFAGNPPAVVFDADAVDGTLASATVGGPAIIVSEGTIGV
jgi:predicted PhzF superfamily epimerase YddE/YHI9